MSMQKLRLVGCERYNLKSELYIKGKVYLVNDIKAKLMLSKVDEYDRPRFVPYVAPAKTRTDRIAEAAAAAAIKAATEAAAAEDEVIDRTADAPGDDVVVEEDPDAAVEVEVDTDDDPDLDDDDVVNSEEVDVDEDRSDGTEVEV
jgi:hypothetical protein